MLCLWEGKSTKNIQNNKEVVLSATNNLFFLIGAKIDVCYFISNSEPNITSKSLSIVVVPAASSVSLALFWTLTFCTLMSPQLVIVLFVVTFWFYY